MKGLVLSIILAILIHGALLLAGNRLLLTKGPPSKRPKSITMALVALKRPSPPSTKAQLSPPPPPKPGPHGIHQLPKIHPIKKKKAPSIPQKRHIHPKLGSPRPKRAMTPRKRPSPSHSPSALTRPKAPSPALRPPKQKAPLFQPSKTKPVPDKGGDSPAAETHSQAPSSPAVSSSVLPKGLRLARPRYLVNRRPPYPLLARRRGYQGTVVLKVLVTREGKVSKLEVEKSSGYKILDKAAMRAVKSWLFDPGLRNGKRVEMWVRVPICFRLQ